MPVLERANSASKDALPDVVREFVHESIQRMSEKELRAWKKKSAKLMRKAKNAAAKRQHSSTPVPAPPAAGKTR
jgi:hypothetical protein